MATPKELLELIERFDNNREAYRSGQYNETQLRREFVDPFFKILGWDVNNEKGYAEAYKDVIHEDSIKVGGVTKAPDYCFRIGGTRKFFVETKKPSVNLKDDISPAFQLRRYAWSAKLPLSILTDFEEFAVYDCRAKPDKSDKSSTARILYLTCAEYAQRWDEIFEIFSRDAVLKGSFDRYAESSKVKKGTASVDDAFLTEIESWRDMLARNLALRNPDLTQHDLNFAVQRTIDRIVFLRICEDRGMEQYGRLMTLQNGDRVYERLCEMFYRADERYNSGLFHFQKEKSRAEPPDTLTIGLIIDDKPLKDIIKNLYYPDSPYEFSVLSADILGQVYEQFLGKVIRLTEGHRAKVEEKPEVRKAGGVYYTPTYIVDYIVKNTVGQLVNSEVRSKKSKIKDITPKEISKIRILDPACGSGSFLLGAYQYLLDWHRDWYVADGREKWATGKTPALYQATSLNPTPAVDAKHENSHHKVAEGAKEGNLSLRALRLCGESNPKSETDNWRLTTAERRRILLNNIYGVDIDQQAVEVTKLSLLLKVLEGESEQTLARQLKLFHERALPDLGNNIKCGNSLIGTDFYNTPLTPLFRGEKVDSALAGGAWSVSDEERRKVNPFDWEKEFPEIMKPAPAGRKQGNGGFDAVIGNPPWGALLTEPELEYLRQRNREIIVRMIDSFMYFVHQGTRKLKFRGYFGMILPDVILYQQDNAKLREFILENFKISYLFNMGDVFDKITRPACILILEQGKAPQHIINIADFSDVSKSNKSNEIWNKARYRSVPQKRIQEIPGALFVTSNPSHYVIWTKANSVPHEVLANLVDEDGIQRGVSPDLKEAFLVDSKTVIKWHLETHKLRKVLTGGKQIKRYFIKRPDLLLIYTNRSDDFRKLSNICKYIDRFKDKITCKEVQEKKHPIYALHRPRDERIFLKSQKLLGVITEDEIIVALDDSQAFATDGLYLFGVHESVDVKYLMAILNSQLFVFIYRLLALEKGRVLAQVKPTVMSRLPIRTINFSDPTDKTQHDRMVVLVDQMLELHKQLASAKTDHDKTVIHRQIDATDRQINQLVYELYGLTEEEIKIVEGKESQ